MSKKVVFVGPQEVGKSTLRKWIFEGESLFKLLENPLEPTYGYENFSYKLLKNLGVFDLAGQEKHRWFTEDKDIFNESDIILNVLDAKQNYKEITDYINESLEIQRKQSKHGIIIFLIHKMDLLDKIEYEKLKNRLNMFQEDYSKYNQYDMNLYFTSIKEDYIFNTINAFIDIFKKSGLDQEKEIDTNLLRLNFHLFRTLNEKKVISAIRLQNILDISKPNLQNLIGSYEQSELIQTKQMEDKVLIYLNQKGEDYYNKVLKSFQSLGDAEIEQMASDASSEITVSIPAQEELELIYGILISDDNGKTLLSAETRDNSLIDALNRANNPQFDLELIPMFLNAMSKFAEEINVQDLSSFRVQGANLKMSSLSRNRLTMTIFTHPSVRIDYVKEDFSILFDYFLDEYQDLFEFFFKTGNATKFLDFIPKMKRELKKISEQYANLSEEMEKFNIEEAKKIYAKINQINEANFPLEEQLHLKSIKVRLLEAILAEDIQAYLNIENEVKKYI